MSAINSTENSSNKTVSTSGEETVSNQTLYVVAGFVILFGIIGNGFICFAFHRFRRIRSLTNYFIVNLAIADLCLVFVLGCWVIIDVIAKPLKFGRKEVQFAVLILNSCDVLSFSASMLNVTAVSLDRYFAIVSPLRYTAIVTKPRARKTIIAIWFYSLVMAGTSTIWTSFERQKDQVLAHHIYIVTLIALSFVVPVLIIICAYTRVFRVAWVQLQRIKSNIPAQTRVRNKACQRNSAKQEIRLALNILAVVLPVSLIWGVYYGIILAKTYDTDFHPHPILDIVIIYLPHFVATVNPIVYILLTKDLRYILKVIITCSRCGSKNRYFQSKRGSQSGASADQLSVDTYRSSMSSGRGRSITTESHSLVLDNPAPPAEFTGPRQVSKEEECFLFNCETPTIQVLGSV